MFQRFIAPKKTYGAIRIQAPRALKRNQKENCMSNIMKVTAASVPLIEIENFALQLLPTTY